MKLLMFFMVICFILWILTKIYSPIEVFTVVLAIGMIPFWFAKFLK